MFVKSQGVLLPEELRSVYDLSNDALGISERDPLRYTFDAGQQFELTEEFVSQMKGFAVVAQFIVQQCGIQDSTLGLDISVNRKKRWVAAWWHKDEWPGTSKPVHGGRATLSNTASTQVSHGPHQPADFELVAFHAVDDHRAQKHNGDTTRTWVTVTHAPDYI